MSAQVPHVRLGLLEPERHVHLAVHHHGLGEMLTRLLPLGGAQIESAEAEMAVGDEGAHLQFLGQGKRVAVLAAGVFQGIVGGGHFAEEPQSPRFVRALTALAGQGQGASGNVEGVFKPPGEDVRFT